MILTCYLSDNKKYTPTIRQLTVKLRNHKLWSSAFKLKVAAFETDILQEKCDALILKANILLFRFLHFFQVLLLEVSVFHVTAAIH